MGNANYILQSALEKWDLFAAEFAPGSIIETNQSNAVVDSKRGRTKREGLEFFLQRGRV